MVYTEILYEKLVYNKYTLIGGKTISPNHVFIKKDKHFTSWAAS